MFDSFNPWYLLIPPLAALLWAVYYWVVVITEGAYIGRWFVVWLYDVTAHTYDDIKQYDMEDERILVVDPILGELGRRRDPLLLDVATGTGRVPHFLLADGRFNDRFHGRIVGLEPAERMLSRAVAHCAPYPGCVDWVRQTAVPLPFADNTFDAVTCLEAVEFFPQPETALREMVRVLQPGGFLMVTRRSGWEARMFFGRYYEPRAYIRLLTEMGLQDVTLFPWQNNYDLLIGHKRKTAVAS